MVSVWRSFGLGGLIAALIASGVQGQESPEAASVYLPDLTPPAIRQVSEIRPTPLSVCADEEGEFLGGFPPNFNGNVWATYEFEGSLYVGGNFFVGAAGSPNGIGRWDGTIWSNLENGIYSWTDTPAVYSLASFDGNIFAGGHFISIGSISANHISRWDGTAWKGVSGGVSGVVYPKVYTMTTHGTHLYVGGEFTTAGGATAWGIARWDGTTWGAVGTGLNARVFTIISHDGNLYAGGAFTKAGIVDIPRVAKWDGSAWSAVGAQVDGIVYALASYGGSLYAGGEFNNADGQAVNHIMQWDGNSWSALAGGVDGDVRALTVNKGSLFVGGRFSNANAEPSGHVAEWDGLEWHSLDSGMDFQVLTLGAYQGDLVAGGGFTRVGGVAASHLAIWTAQSWQPLSDGFNGSVYDFSQEADTLYAVGRFTTGVGVGANHVARWEPTGGWTSLGEGISGPTDPAFGVDLAVINAVVVHEHDVWVGGSFAGAGEVQAFNLARWDGSSWQAGATSMNGSISDLATFAGDLFAGGDFTVINATSAWGITRWDGTGWLPVGSGLDGPVYVLTEFDGSLYAGGIFTSAGSSPAYGLARWDGLNWISVSTSPSSPQVLALASFEGRLIVSGNFGSFNGVSAQNIVQFDGSVWLPLGAGLNKPVRAIVQHGDELYAGGEFYGSGAQDILFIARWDGTQWCSLGEGMDPEHGFGTVNTLISHAGTVFVGGDFSVADDLPSGFMARWKAGSPNPVAFRSYGARWANRRAEIEWETAVSDQLQFRLYRKDRATEFRSLDVAVVRTNSRFRVTDASADPTQSYVYRVIASSINNKDVASIEVTLAGNTPSFTLHQNTPNPFREATTVRFEISDAADVELAIYDVAGRKCGTVVRESMQPGWYSIVIEPSDLSAGVYLLRLTAGNHTQSTKFTLLR